MRQGRRASGPHGSHRGPQAPYPPAHPQLTHTVLAAWAELEAGIADTPEAAVGVDAAAVAAEAAAHQALVHVCSGGKAAGGETRTQAADPLPAAPASPLSGGQPYPRTPAWRASPGSPRGTGSGRSPGC